MSRSFDLDPTDNTSEKERLRTCRHFKLLEQYSQLGLFLMLKSFESFDHWTLTDYRNMNNSQGKGGMDTYSDFMTDSEEGSQLVFVMLVHVK